MPLILDTSKQFRSTNELAELVQAISSAPSTESEPDWLEWKREADLNERRWHALIAKCIAGFANRDPVVANGWAGGCSYLVIGAEPGSVIGVSPIDNANLHAGVSRFVRETVRWSPQYMQHDGRQVLVITVEPPEYGDQMVAMLASYQPQERGASVCRKGEVFLRRYGKTDLAGQEDYDMLVRRFAGGAKRASGIRVEVLDTATAVPVACDSDDITNWQQRQERALLARTGIELANLMAGFEHRSAAGYRQEVASYLAQMAPLLPSIARSMALMDSSPSMQLIVINETEHNFTGIRAEVTIEGDVCAYRSAEDAQPEIPTPPRKSGSHSGPSIPIIPPRSIVLATPAGPYIHNSASTSIEFDDVDLRPSGRVELDPIYLVSDAKLAGATLTAKWRATSSNAEGVVSGEFPIRVSSEISRLRIE